MRTSSLQQALTGLAVALVIAATLLGGLILAFSDMARTGRSFTGGLPTATIYRIPTLPPDTATSHPEQGIIEVPTGTNTPRPTSTVRPSATREATATIQSTSTGTPRPTDTLRPTDSPTARPTQRRTSAPRPTVAATVTPTPRAGTVAPDVTGTQSSTDGICTNPDSIIIAPRVGSVLTGTVEFYGTARIPGFSFYKLEIRLEPWSTASDYVTFYTSYRPVKNGLLGTLDTTPWEDGEYWIRLVVVDTTGNYPERCAILYTID